MPTRDEHARPVLRVVVAEDERPARELLAAALRRRQDVKIVAEVHDGCSLRQALGGDDVDVVFMDDGLPNRATVADLLPPAGPVIVLTSTDATPPGSRATSASERIDSSLVLPKPWTNVELEAMLRAVRASVAARRSTGSSASPMWSPLLASSAAKRDAPGQTANSEASSRRWDVVRGIAGLVVLWTVLYLLVLAPSGASSRDAVIAGRAVDDAMQTHVRLSFSSLSGFEYRPGMAKSELPAVVRRAEGREVAIDGYMLPIDVNGDGVSRFLLNASYDVCIRGMVAGAPHQWVAVDMADGRLAPVTHMPIVVFGRLDIGEQRRNGRVMSMYRLRADKVALNHY